ncbi:MAG: hypothetical protein MUF64_30930 [Polyangiaceae bacterium]|jgi:hypothetical protein|nr:hypothetical protein [Polyangiaceae bacterium]
MVQKERDMEWFRQGGWGMFPVLIVGLVSLGSAAFFAARGDAGLRPSLRALSRALVGFMVTAVASNLIAVCFFLQRPELDDGTRVRLLLQGTGESLTPLTLGGAFLALLWLLVAVGERRIAQRLA